MKLTLNNEQVETALKRYVAEMLNIKIERTKVATVIRHHGGLVSANIFVEDD